MKTKVAVLWCFSAVFLYSMFFVINTTFALGVNPTKTIIDLKPGETKEIEVTLLNNDPSPEAIGLKEAIVVLENGVKKYYEADNAEITEAANSLRKYMTLSKDKTAQLNPGDSEVLTITISAPADIVPGTYLGAYFASAAAAEKDAEEGSIGAAVSTRMVVLVIANIGMENAKEELTLDKFEIDQAQLDAGSLKLNAEIVNNGTFASVPSGTITFYQEGSKQLVKEILREVQTVGNEIITKGFKDEIAFNKKQIQVFPGGTTTTISTTTDENTIINLRPGKYYAQLEAFYGVDGSKLEAKTDIFEIKEMVYVDSFTATKSSIFDNKVTFDGRVVNNGQSAIDLGGNIYIKNIFGQNVDIINLTQQKVLAGGPYGIQKEWVASKGLGVYFASLSLNYNDTTLEKTISIYHINGLQIGIAIAVIILLVVIVYFFTKNYLKLKKRADNKADKKKE